MDEDEHLHRIFLDEARTRVRALSRAAEHPARRGARYQMWRHAHTLKGLAGMLGHRQIAVHAQEVASRLKDAEGRFTDVDREDARRLREEISTLVREVEQLPYT